MRVSDQSARLGVEAEGGGAPATNPFEMLVELVAEADKPTNLAPRSRALDLASLEYIFGLAKTRVLIFTRRLGRQTYTREAAISLANAVKMAENKNFEITIIAKSDILNRDTHPFLTTLAAELGTQSFYKMVRILNVEPGGKFSSMEHSFIVIDEAISRICKASPETSPPADRYENEIVSVTNLADAKTADRLAKCFDNIKYQAQKEEEVV